MPPQNSGVKFSRAIAAVAALAMLRGLVSASTVPVPDNVVIGAQGATHELPQAGRLSHPKRGQPIRTGEPWTAAPTSTRHQARVNFGRFSTPMGVLCDIIKQEADPDAANRHDSESADYERTHQDYGVTLDKTWQQQLFEGVLSVGTLCEIAYPGNRLPAPPQVEGTDEALEDDEW